MENVYDIFGMRESHLKMLCHKTKIPYEKLEHASKSRILSFRHEKNIKITDIYSDDYPVLLRYIHGAPIILYYIGTLPESLSVSIVGSRLNDNYGRQCAHEISSELSVQGYDIVSGLAKGIDAISHKGALLNNTTTTAVLGTGVDICYPAENRQLYFDIIEKGCILSEFPPGTGPSKINFPKRNRIISGISFCTIIVQAAKRSGSFITANFALEQGRDVYCVPDRMDSQYQGTNWLIKQGAGIITDVSAFITELQAIELNWKSIYYC